MLSCEKGSRMHIYEASYRKENLEGCAPRPTTNSTLNCSVSAAMDFVELCEGKVSCKVPVSVHNTLCPDPAYGIISVVYACYDEGAQTKADLLAVSPKMPFPVNGTPTVWGYSNL